jgi:hypothetical protein
MYGTKIIQKHSALIISTIISIFLMEIDSYTITKIAGWGASKDAVIKEYLQNDKNIIRFKPSEKPEYKNKILTYIVAIDADLANSIDIIRSSTRPEKDFLFVKDRLYSILENRGPIGKSSEDRLINELKSAYGNPGIQKDNQSLIYSFKDNETKVLLILSKEAGSSVCTLYYYASKLFKMLLYN